MPGQWVLDRALSEIVGWLDRRRDLPELVIGPLLLRLDGDRLVFRVAGLELDAAGPGRFDLPDLPDDDPPGPPAPRKVRAAPPAAPPAPRP